MELGVIGGVLGLGWYLSKQVNPPQENNVPVVDTTQDTFYHSSQLARAKLGDATHGMLMNAKSKEGLEQGKVIAKDTPNRISTDTQNVVDPFRYSHNNMQPFFGGRIKQDMRTSGFETKLEKFTGMDPYRRAKTEQKSLFEPRPDIGHVYGMPSNTDAFQDRAVRSRYVNNEKTFEEERVGPGLGEGFTTTPSGGFQQSKTLDYSRPKNVDQMRVSTNPKLTYRGRVIKGQATVPLRGDIGKVHKQKPEGFFRFTKDRYLVTTGAYVREKQRPLVILKNTQRMKSRMIQGHAASQDAKASPVRSQIQNSSRQQLQDTGLRNAHDVNASKHGDYGVEGYYAGPTERMITGVRNYLGPVGETVSAVVTPIMDAIRPTKKEDFIVNQRPEGQLAVREKPRVWDPNDVARTTIKETLIHGATLANPRTPYADKPIMGLQDDVRTTQKETSLIEGHVQQAKTTVNSPGTRDAWVENAHINAHKEKTLEGRAPVAQGAKETVGGDSYGDVRHTKLDSDRVNQRSFGNVGPMASSHTGPPIDRIGENTKVKQDDRTLSVNMERISPHQLKPLSTNPFV